MDKVTEAMLDAAEQAYDAVAPGHDAHRYGLSRAYLAMRAAEPPSGVVEAVERVRDRMLDDWGDRNPDDEARVRIGDLRTLIAALQSTAPARMGEVNTICTNRHCGDSSRCWDCDGCRAHAALTPSGTANNGDKK